MPKSQSRAVTLRNKGSQSGGKSRAKKLNTQQRQAIARKGAQAKNKESK